MESSDVPPIPTGKRRCFMCLKAEKDEQFTSFLVTERIKCFEPLLYYLTGAPHDDYQEGTEDQDGSEDEDQDDLLSILKRTFKEVPPLCVGCCDILGDLYDLHQALVEIQQKIEMQTGIARSVIKRSYQASGIVMESYEEAEEFRCSPVVKLRREILMKADNPVLFPCQVPPEIILYTDDAPIQEVGEAEPLIEMDGETTPESEEDATLSNVVLLVQVADDQVLALPVISPAPPEEEPAMEVEYNEDCDGEDANTLTLDITDSQDEDVSFEEILEPEENPDDCLDINEMPESTCDQTLNYANELSESEFQEFLNEEVEEQESYQYFRIEPCEESNPPAFEPVLIKVPKSYCSQLIQDISTDPETTTEHPGPSISPPVKVVEPILSTQLEPPHLSPVQSDVFAITEPPFSPSSSVELTITSPSLPPTQNSGEMPENPDDLVSTPEETHPCDVCSDDVLKTDIYFHLQSHVGPDFVFDCESCQVAFLTPFRLDAFHKSRLKIAKCPTYNPAGSLDAYLKCERCEFKADTIFTLKEHLNSHEDVELEKPLNCPICAASFSLQVSVLIHLQDHHIFNKTKRRFETCEQCGHSFPVHEIESHLQNAHNMSSEMMLRCGLCPGVFSSLKGLVEHQQKSKALKIHPISCHLCNINFTWIADLRTHYFKDHNQREEHLCQNCMVSFFSEKLLQSHLKHCGGSQQVEAPVECVEELVSEEDEIWRIDCDEDYPLVIVDDLEHEACDETVMSPTPSQPMVSPRYPPPPPSPLSPPRSPSPPPRSPSPPIRSPSPPPYSPLPPPCSPSPPPRSPSPPPRSPSPPHVDLIPHVASPPPPPKSPHSSGPPSPRLRCHQCDQTFIRELTLRKHIRLAHSTQEETTPKSASAILSTIDFGASIWKPKDASFDCGICSRKFKNEGMLGCHINAEHVKAKGKVSDEDYMKLRSIAKEKKYKKVKPSVKERPYGCRKCGQRFRHISNRHTHEKAHERLGEKFKPLGPNRKGKKADRKKGESGESSEIKELDFETKVQKNARSI